MDGADLGFVVWFISFTVQVIMRGFNVSPAIFNVLLTTYYFAVFTLFIVSTNLEPGVMNS